MTDWKAHVTPRLNKAMLIAKAYHAGQKYGEMPYMNHVSDVYTTARALGVIDEDTLIACLLHDTLEDTTYTGEQLLKDFGADVFLMVQFCTDSEAPTRKERKAKTYLYWKGLIETGLDYIDGAITVKLCDRYMNTLTGAKNDMYQKEHDAFKEALTTPKSVDIHNKLWEMIETNLYGDYNEEKVAA